MANTKPNPKKAAPRSAIKPEDKPLTTQERLFVKYYLSSEKLSPERAAKNAGYAPSVSRTSAYQWVSNPQQKPNVYAAVQKGIAARMKRLDVSQDDIVRGLLNEVVGDRNALIQYRRNCCRHCYGENHRYQRTAGERETAIDQHDEYILQAKVNRIPLSPKDVKFDEKGGIGYDPRKEPIENCPECFGEGEGRIFVADTRKLDPESLALYDGVELGKEGLKVKMPDRAAATKLLMQHIGMLDKKVTVKGDGMNPLELLLRQVSGNALKPVKDEE